jgi:hypothetical protein
MTTKSQQSIYGASVRAATERAKEARKEADRLACEAWTKRMFGFRGPAQPSPTLGDALNAGYLYLEVRCVGCDTQRAARWLIPVLKKAINLGLCNFDCSNTA